MNNEAFTHSTDFIWQGYQFSFNDSSASDQELFAAVREKLLSLGLQENATAIRYEKAEDSSQLNIWVQQRDNQQVRSLLHVQDTVIFQNEPLEAAVNAGMAGSNPERLAAGALDEPEVETVTYKGAVRNPPPTSDPLP